MNINHSSLAKTMKEKQNSRLDKEMSSLATRANLKEIQEHKINEIIVQRNKKNEKFKEQQLK